MTTVRPRLRPWQLRLCAVVAVWTIVGTLSACGQAGQTDNAPKTAENLTASTGPTIELTEQPPSLTVVTVPPLPRASAGAAGDGSGEVAGSVADSQEVGAVPSIDAGAGDGSVVIPGVSNADETTAPISDANAGLPPTGAPSTTVSTARPHQPTSASVSSTTASIGTSDAPVATVAVDLAACDGCTVIGVAPGVRNGLAAALATAPRGAVLLATRADGTVSGAINVPYGVTFRAPNGPLPCDGSGRCFVIGDQGGEAVVSAFSLGPDGTWRDVTAAGGFRSATGTVAIRDFTDDGLLDIAVQARQPRGVLWVVHAWSGDRFAVAGCALDPGSAPSNEALSMGACTA